MKAAKRNGEKSGTLNKLSIYTRLVWVLGAVIVLAAILFLARGWVRNSLEPAYADLLYAHQVQATLDEQGRILHDPLQALGFSKGITAKSAVCHRSLALSIHTAIDCSASYQAYGPVSSDKATLRKNAVSLQAKLLQDGWSGNPVMPLTQFINGITDGADNQPDATYLKHFGSISCMLSPTTAFKSPDTPAMNIVFSCSRDVLLFGNAYTAQRSGGSDGSSSTPY